MHLISKGSREHSCSRQLWGRKPQQIPPPKKRSALDTLLGSSFEEEDSNKVMDQDEDGDNETVRKEILLYFGETPITRDNDSLK